MPRLTLRLTLELGASFLRGEGLWETTRPAFTLAENTFVTFPTEQCDLLIAVLAAASFLPFTFGTMQSILKVAVAARFTLIVSVQLPLPEQSPDQPANLEREEAEAVSLTEVP